MASVRVLIIDDSNAMRKVLALSLRKAGAEVSEVWEAGNGQEALSILENKHPDFMLCDINMPVMNGLEFVKAVKAVPSVSEIPVIMVTTEGGERMVVEALSYGAKGYIRKPFTQEQFASCIIPLIT